MPTIDVIIPFYNSWDTINRAIKSVQSQSVNAQIKITIIDDGSDAPLTMRHLDHYIEKIQIRIIRSEKNLGAGVARRLGIESTDGSFIFFLDSDDEWLSNHVAKHLEVYNLHPDCIGVSSRVLKGEGEDDILRLFNGKIGYYHLLVKNWLLTSASSIARSAIGSVKYPVLKKRQDYAFWLLVAKHNMPQKYIKVPVATVRYHQQLDSLSSNKFDNIKWNFRVFRNEMRFNVFFSIIFTLMNVLSYFFLRRQ